MDIVLRLVIDQEAGTITQTEVAEVTNKDFATVAAWALNYILMGPCEADRKIAAKALSCLGMKVDPVSCN